jgi:hypothetical protein
MLAEDCAADHWCTAFSGHREGSQWRANCPHPGCGAERALEWDVPRKSIRWKSWCADHDKETLRPVLGERLQGCLPRRQADRLPITRDDLIALVLTEDLPPMTLRLRLLELAGMSTPEALGKLGVRRENRSRVIGGQSGAASKRMQTRKNGPHPNG